MFQRQLERDKSRKEAEASRARYRETMITVEQQSEDDAEYWQGRQEYHKKQIYGDRAGKPDSPDPSESDMSDSGYVEGDGNRAEEHREPARRVPERGSVRRAPPMTEQQRIAEHEKEVREAMELLRGVGIYNIPPNSGKCSEGDVGIKLTGNSSEGTPP